VLRTALKPRWLALFALLVVVVVTFAELGVWQLHVAQDKGLADALRKAHEARPVQVDSLLRPHQTYPGSASGRPVTATGRYAADGQLLVGPRRLDGRTGWWVVTPLVVQASGGRLAVVRGFVESPQDVSAPPSGDVQLTGAMAQGESPSTTPATTGGSDGGPATPELGSVDLAVLVNRWPGDLYNAFVFAEQEQADGRELALSPGLHRVPPPEVTGGLEWRNAAYALQWWMFAAFAAYMWFRMVRDDADRDLHEDRDEDRAQTTQGEPA
jgi:cytochrome oxidase assembly protein ShyY1